MNKQQFAQFLISLQKVLPKYAPHIDDAMIEAWYQAFKFNSLEELRGVYVALRDHETEFPSIARIKTLLSSVSKAESRFNELVNLISSHGCYRPPQTDELMMRTINQLGGWQRVCEWTNNDLPYRQKDFDAAYSDIEHSSALGCFSNSEKPRLAGVHESTGGLALPENVRFLIKNLTED